MKIGKAELFLLGYMPVYITIVLFANALFLTVADCPGGGCDEITLVEMFLFGLTVLIFAFLGIFGYIGLKKKK